MTATALGADSTALAAAALAAEEALCLQREALAILSEGWGGESGSAAVDRVQQQCIEGSGVVAELQRVAGELALLADRLTEGADPGVPAPGPLADGAAASGAQPMPAPAPAPAPPAWPAAGMGLPAAPGLGGSLVGLAAQIAELFGSGAELAVEEPIESPLGEPIEELTPQEPAPQEPDKGADGPAPAAVVTQPQQQDPAGSPPAPVTVPTAVPQQDWPSGAVTAVEPEPDPEPLLAAEVPPPVIPAADPVPESATPCEIAADELPQVGG